MKLPAAILAALLALAPGALAQPGAAATPALATAAIAQLENSLYGACVGAPREISLIAAGPAPLRLEVDRQMRASGIQIARNIYRVTGCGRPSRRHNIEIVTPPSQQARAVALPIGTTALTSIVLKSVMDSLMAPMMRARYPRCQPSALKIFEANVSDGAPYESGAAWSELWRYDACGRGGIAEIRFTYDGEGVRMTANVMPAD